MPTNSAERDAIEVISWTLLAAATVGSAWCAYQSSLWSGEQTRGLARASVAQFEASRLTTVANRNMTVDAATFIDYVSADLHHDTKVAGFLRSHARPEFKPAFDAWIADEAAGRSVAPNPFQYPQYKLSDQERAAALDAQAAVDIGKANEANGYSDSYVMHTVIFALALFFLGATSETRRGGIRKMVLVFGALVFFLSVLSVARLPRQPSIAPRRLVEAPDAKPG
jgi:hypothetical protein